MSEFHARLLVVNPNTSELTTTMMVHAARWAAARFGEDVEVFGATAAFGPAMIVEPQALAEAAEQTWKAGMAGVDQHHPDAVIVAAFGDPGATELRDALSIPVIGIGEAAVREAASRTNRFAIVTSTPLLREALDDLVAKHCPGANFAGVFASQGDPMELARDPERNVAALNRAVHDAVAAGADSVVIGGGPLTSAARRLAVRTDVAVIEPVPCAVDVALRTLRAAATVLPSGA